MNRKVIFLVLLFSLSFLGVNAQSRYTLKGTIIDGSTGESIPFANLIVEGTKSGVASDMDGNFEFYLPLQYKEKTIRVSVIGYQKYDIKVADAASMPRLEIVLKPISLEIQMVNVAAPSLVYKRMIQNAVNNISENYFSAPYSYKGYFQDVVKKGGEEVRVEAVVSIYDKTGYKRSDVSEAFDELNYSVEEIRRSDSKDVKLNFINFDDILTADIVRNPRNVMDIDNIRDFVLTNKGTYPYDDDTVQVIGYSVKSPNIINTGSNKVESYSGEIYINKKNYSVIKNIINIVMTDYNSSGRNLSVVRENTKEKGPKVTFQIVTNYRKSNQVQYYLGDINIAYSYTVNGIKTEGLKRFTTLGFNNSDPQVISGRNYYNNADEKKDFWDSFKTDFQD